MLRVKRSVVARFNTDVSFIASQAVARQQQMAQDSATDVQDGDDDEDDGKSDAMAKLERQARAPVGFVAASTGPEVSKIASERNGKENDGPVAVRNSEEVELDLDD
ncbi:pre-mRNA-splicing factor syf1 [Oleoguttula sp. CCFEE 5521]